VAEMEAVFDGEFVDKNKFVEFATAVSAEVEGDAAFHAAMCALFGLDAKLVAMPIVAEPVVLKSSMTDPFKSTVKLI
jgi:hypothetical protein